MSYVMSVSTIPSIASDLKKDDLARTMPAIGSRSISRVPAPCFYSSTSIQWGNYRVEDIGSLGKP